MEPLNRAMEDYFAPMAAAAESHAHGNLDKTKAFECDVIAWDPVREGHPAFAPLMEDSSLREATEAVIGDDFHTSTSLVMFSVGRGRGQAWHQDCPSDDSGLFNLNRLLYTQDVGEENGCIVVVPGSHKAGRIPPGGHQEPIDGEVRLSPKAGTLVLLHGHVYHRVTPNHTDQPRLSVNLRAYPHGVSEDVTCIGVYRNGTVDFCEKPRTPED